MPGGLNAPGGNVRVEWLVLADSAEVLGNKVYMLGGGWTCLRVHSAFPVQQHFAVCVAVGLGQSEMGLPQEFAVDLLDPHGKLMLTLEAEFVVKSSVEQRWPQPRWHFASAVELRLEGPGCYPVVVHLNGEESHRTQFEVCAAPR